MIIPTMATPELGIRNVDLQPSCSINLRATVVPEELKEKRKHEGGAGEEEREKRREARKEEEDKKFTNRSPTNHSSN
jgi:hypothetical protein